MEPKLRAVVVDDNPEIQRLVTLALQGTGRVDVVGLADDGWYGAELAVCMQPDLVVIDINMPRMNGFQATHEIKHALPETKVLMMSATYDPEIRKVALDCGADAFMPKRDIQSCAEYLSRLFPET